jgi:rubrerythrin
MRRALLRAFFRRGSEQIIYECRNCGEAVSHDAESCPVCGCDGIARYEID